MQQTYESEPTGGDGPPWTEPQAMDLWKYFGSVGAADKNTMVTVGSWLLGFSATIIGYVVTKLLIFPPLAVNEPFTGICLGLLGIVISCVAGYVSLLYGGYSNWNWAQADAIARDQATRYPKWGELLPENAKAAAEKGTGTARTPSWFSAVAARLGRPCDPNTQLAPIFSLYAWLALCAALFHLMVLLLSACILR